MLAFNCAAYGQFNYDYKWAIFTEVNSIIRTNSSANIHVERRFKGYRFALGLDSYYDNLGAERQFRKDAFSYALTFKAGKEVMYKDNKVFQTGFFVRFADFHIYQYDEIPDYDDDFREYGIYKKDYGKITPMIFLQYDFDIYDDILFGFQVAMGYPIIFDVHSELATGTSPYLKNDGYPSNFWNNFLEHNVPFNRWGNGNEVCIQFNLLAGYKF
jgi:hypothetical protein